MSILSKHLVNLQSQGRYVFSKGEFACQSETSDDYLRVALSREIRKGNLYYIGKSLYVIVPPKYKTMGAPPPEWYIHDLMQAHQCHYYVGLLTTAVLHGASHQAV